ncbi:MAG: YjjW family glycine radical enzyme activase [Lachnospiraceae bacterium]|nr:YjjW family glycine radical enzyme activase [Lachnospiraceae bacterium]
MVRVPVNRIIPFSSVDGPGSRTAVFLQGCNLNCWYCHNPETRNSCVHCGACVAVCETGALHWTESLNEDGSRKVGYDHTKCVFCDSCIETCANGSSPRIRQMNAKEVYEEIARQLPFIRGVTVSGGECMLWPQFLEELLGLCKKNGLHTLIDSNGTVDFSRFPQLMEVTDGVMLDVKAIREEEHKKMTSSSNQMVLQNLRWLLAQKKLEEVRTVIVPGLFDLEETVETVAGILSVQENRDGAYKPIYKLIAYREQGVRKEYRLFQPPNAGRMEKLADLANKAGAENVQIV